jgi:hypothetical protein
MINRKFIINADFKGQAIEDGLHIRVQVRESMKAMVVRAFISAVALRVVRHIVNGIIEDLNKKTELKIKKGRIIDVEA